MLGWWFIVSTQTPEEQDEAVRNKTASLARWETSINGIKWVQKLVDDGKATQHRANGYPNRYTARAGDVLPLLANGPPAHTGPTVLGEDYVMPGNWSGNIVFDHDAIAACPPDETLTIDAWDLS